MIAFLSVLPSGGVWAVLIEAQPVNSSDVTKIVLPRRFFIAEFVKCQISIAQSIV